MAMRARTNLFEAWKVHWNILFPDEPDCAATLKAWVVSSLVIFDAAKPFQPPIQTEVADPDWLGRLDIRVGVNGAGIGSASDQQQLAPWFANQMVESKPQWEPNHGKHVHPFKRLAETPEGDRPNHEHRSRESQAALQNVTLRIGTSIRQEMQFKLRIGHLQAAGIHSRTDEDVERVEIVRRLNDGYQLDVLNGSMSGNGNRPPINDLRISRGSFYEKGAKLPHSFEEYDLALLERMKLMIDTVQVPSARKAAEEVAELAFSKGKRDSAIERLERGFGTHMSG